MDTPGNWQSSICTELSSIMAKRRRTSSDESQIMVRKAETGWQVVEGWWGDDGQAEYTVVMQAGMTYHDAVLYAMRLRNSLGYE